MCSKWVLGCALAIIGAAQLAALNPHRTLTQYTHTIWTVEHGLPQDTIHAISQTKDRYLWVGTDEGLAQFDGYDFTVFNKENGALPSDSINALFAATDGSLWIGTTAGLTRYYQGKFTSFSRKDGLPDSFINSITQDRSGDIWVVAGSYLSRLQNGKFITYQPGDGLPIESMRAVYTGHDGTLYVAGYSGLARREGNRFVPVITKSQIGDSVVTTLIEDRNGNIWAANNGLLKRTPSGQFKRYTTSDGLPDILVRSIWEDRDGNLWVGTNGGLSRLEGDRFVSSPLASSRGADWVRSIYEDTEGNLWVGMNSGLNRFRDGTFTNYGVPEGLPSDEPTAVYQDRRGRIWIGFHDQGLIEFGNPRRAYTMRDGLPGNEIFSIREDHNGDLLIATRDGISRMHDGHLTSQVVRDALNRRLALDYLETSSGKLLVASTSGLTELDSGHPGKNLIPGGPLLNDAVVTVLEARDGTMWAGTFGKGLWRLRNGNLRLFTTADGLSSNQIQSLTEDSDGTVWIGTFGGGLDAVRDDRFQYATARDGLLSDNIAHVEIDFQGWLWLSTTRGICRVRKSDLLDFFSSKIRSVTTVNYGVSDGLRSAQCAPSYPTSTGGIRSKDGRLWFPTGRGLAVFDPTEKTTLPAAPVVHLLDLQVDGRLLSLNAAANLAPGSGRLQFRYTAIHLSAPEKVRYSFQLEGLDQDWTTGVTRRVTNYNSLPHGHYRFKVRATVPGAPTSEAAFAFQLLPYFYETAWFRYLCAAAAALAIWGLFRLRLRQIRQRFALVLEERARLAREIHDTLAQGFVGISSQLDAVALTLKSHTELAAKHLDLARKMARHSLTEARRSVMDLRDSALEGQELPAALSEAARQWTAGSPVCVQVDVSGNGCKLPEEMEQNLLRIAQEAVTNAIKHAGAKEVRIRLALQPKQLSMVVADDGKGFEQTEAFSETGGHFGLLGMRERAERLGGQLRLASQPGQGTKVEVTVPLT
ncbi:MAG TPA: two-component regulator propeller domain-containing protein [Bryobacteraceae bacterium]|nr:two-component regulator propeller domain-containing protein [Bryobacteraceae bacterium]